MFADRGVRFHVSIEPRQVHVRRSRSYTAITSFRTIGNTAGIEVTIAGGFRGETSKLMGLLIRKMRQSVSRRPRPTRGHSRAWAIEPYAIRQASDRVIDRQELMTEPVRETR
jgi:hypothetical protein